MMRLEPWSDAMSNIGRKRLSSNQRPQRQNLSHPSWSKYDFQIVSGCSNWTAEELVVHQEEGHVAYSVGVSVLKLGFTRSLYIYMIIYNIYIYVACQMVFDKHIDALAWAGRSCHADRSCWSQHFDSDWRHSGLGSGRWRWVLLGSWFFLWIAVPTRVRSALWTKQTKETWQDLQIRRLEEGLKKVQSFWIIPKPPRVYD